ncbi:MAG: prephenate dehydrogenase [Rikenellaceae bacterium]|nr:prephenate dehydrogenase [Rikenellaceae bacterium]
MIATVIGLGLIGGSFALALKDKGLADKVIGVDNNPANAAKALELGLVDEVLPMEAAVDASDLIAMAIPVNAIPLLSVKILNRVKHQIVMDMGSTKEELCEVIAQHAKRGRFVATHPMWGTEYSGPEAAVKGAFAGRSVVICQREMSDPEAVGVVEDVYRRIGLPVIYMEPEEHALHAAYVSHISHITSFALALTVLEKEREEEAIFDLAGGGFESTVRLAKSSGDMWIPILLKNKYNVLDVLREHIHQLQIMRRMIERDDAEGLRAAILKANSIRRIIH